MTLGLNLIAQAQTPSFLLKPPTFKGIIGMKTLAQVFFGAAMAALVALPAQAGLSPAVGNPLKDAQRMVGSNPSGAQAKIQQARGAAATAEEKRAVSQMAAYVYGRSGNYTALAQELQSQGGSAIQIARAYYTAKNYGKAVEFAGKAGGADGKLIVAQSYLNMGNTAKAIDGYKALVAIAPKSEYFSQLAGLQYKSGDKKGYGETLEKMIRRDPSPANWKSLLGNLKRQPMADSAKLALFQLVQETGNLSGAEDYQEMAKLAMVTGAPAMAKNLLETAIASKAITGDAVTLGLIKSAAGRIAASNADIPRYSVSESGNDVSRAGRTYFGAGQYPQAIGLLTKASKMANSAAESNLYLGLVHLKQGDKAAAMAAFKAIPAGSVYADVGALWSLYTSVKG
jgi:tetratricopeptide (TPR) repeat protein